MPRNIFLKIIFLKIQELDMLFKHGDEILIF